MDRKQALKVFGISGSASRDEIARRYDVLQRKRHAAQLDGNAATRPEEMSSGEDIEEAYKILAGIAYKDPVAEKRLRERNEHPGLVARLLKMEQTKLDNIIHYYKWPALAVVAVIALVAWFIVSTVLKPSDDFRMLIAGDVYVQDVDLFEKQVASLLPGTEHPMVQNIYLSEDTDPQMQSAIVQKLIVEIGYGENDIMVLDRTLFDQYASQGAFTSLDGMLADFGTTPEKQDKQKLTLAPDVRPEGEDGNPHVYGINVTDSSFLKEKGVLGTEMIAVFGPKPGFPDKGRTVMMELMK